MLVFDFFSKYGFGDGDNRALVKEARKCRTEVLKRLNEEFEGRGLPYRVHAEYYTTVHNTVRAVMAWEKGGKRFEWEGAYGVICVEEVEAAGGLVTTRDYDIPDDAREVVEAVSKFF